MATKWNGTINNTAKLEERYDGWEVMIIIIIKFSVCASTTYSSSHSLSSPSRSVSSLIFSYFFFFLSVLISRFLLLFNCFSIAQQKKKNLMSTVPSYPKYKVWCFFGTGMSFNPKYFPINICLNRHPFFQSFHSHRTQYDLSLVSVDKQRNLWLFLTIKLCPRRLFFLCPCG